MWNRPGSSLTTRARRRYLPCRWGIFFLLSATCGGGYIQSRVEEQTDIAAVLRSCGAFEVGINVAREDDSAIFPDYITDVMFLADHIFVLSLNGCKTSLRGDLVRKTTCVLGERLDSCAPLEFRTGSYKHAMKVSFMHAVVLHVAKQSGLRHALVIEDDISVHVRDYSHEFVTDVAALLNSDAWSLIRFGFRPYFLESEGASPCSSVCRCKVGQFGHHLCGLRRSGCDLRSSDFYFINSNVFLKLRDKILDRKQPTTRRIIDVHPMRSFPNQWLVLPQVSSQNVLDIPVDYQIGLGAAYVHKCVGPRPLPKTLLQQKVSS